MKVPHDPTAERMIVGDALVRRSTLGRIAEVCKVGDFYDPRWRRVLNLLDVIWLDDEAERLARVARLCEVDRGELERALEDSDWQCMRHARMVREMAEKRRAVQEHLDALAALDEDLMEAV